MFYRELREMEKRLITVMSEIKFGRLENIRIENGNIISGFTGKRILSVKFDRDDPPYHRNRADGDFQLTENHLRLIEKIRSSENAFIRKIQIFNGLPMDAEFEEDFSIISG